MSLGENLQYLRKMHNGITQEELAEQVDVSRQTVSKWEMNLCYPEVNKIMELCSFFNCTMDQLVRENINLSCENYSDIRIEEVPTFDYVRYTVISADPEDDALRRMSAWAGQNGIADPQLIGWDFPFLSQEQINVYHMHGYTAACILPENMVVDEDSMELLHQDKQKYAVITIKNPMSAPFALIPRAYKALMSYMQVNAILHKEAKNVIGCFEKEYQKEGCDYMDVYIAADL